MRLASALVTQNGVSALNTHFLEAYGAVALARPHVEQSLGLGVSEVGGLVFFVDNVQSFLEVSTEGAILTVNVSLFGQTYAWSGVSNNTNSLGLRVKLSCTHFNLTLSRCVSLWVVREVDLCGLKALNVAHEGTHVYLWVRLYHLDLVLKVHRAVTFHLKLLLVGLTNRATSTHVDETWEKFVLRGVDNWKRMDGNQNFVTVTVDPHRVVVVLVLIDSGCELDVDVLGDASRNHALLLVLYLEVAGLWR